MRGKAILYIIKSSIQNTLLFKGSFFIRLVTVFMAELSSIIEKIFRATITTIAIARINQTGIFFLLFLSFFDGSVGIAITESKSFEITVLVVPLL